MGYRIRKIRESKDFNQLHISNELGITAGAYAKIERGKTDPSISRLFEIAKILEVDVVAFIKDDYKSEATSKTTSTISREEFDLLSQKVNELTKQLTKQAPAKAKK